MPAPSTIPTAALQKEHYIRTYAMDLARMQGTAGATTGNVAAPTPPPAVDESLIVRDGRSSTPELSQLEREAEMRDVRASAAEEEIAKELGSIEKPTADPINLPRVSADLPQQASIPAALPAEQAAPEPEHARESILQRLFGQHKSSYKAPTIQPILPQKIAPADTTPVAVDEMNVAPKMAIPASKEKVAPEAPPNLPTGSAHEAVFKAEPAPPIPGAMPRPITQPESTRFGDEERKQMLERLRSRAKEQAEQAAQPVAPIAPIAPVNLAPGSKPDTASLSKAPSHNPLHPSANRPYHVPVIPPQLIQEELSYARYAKPMPPLPTHPVPPIAFPAPEATPQAIENASDPLPAAPQIPQSPAPTPFHSFSSDFAAQVDARGASTFSVLAAERDSRPQVVASHPQKKRREILPILAGVVLIIGGGVGVFAAYNYMHNKAPVGLNPTVPSLISADEYIPLTGSYLSGALAASANQPIPQGEVAVTYVNISTSTKQGLVQIPQPGGVLISDLNLPAPDILLRNIDPSSTVGVVHAGSETRPFFLLRATSYDRTFIGMLDWEPTLANDLSQFYPAYPAVAAAISTSTATSTTTSTVPVTPSAPSTSGQFVDDIVNSHSVRILRDAQGRTIMLYGYTADKQTLIIARDEAAFTLLLGRLSASTK